MNNDELLARVQSECVHEWQNTPGIGRQCHKCSLLWEVWAEQRIQGLEQRFSEEFERQSDDDDDDSYAVFFWTLLPPQTKRTCPQCNGTGQRAFGDCIVICKMCGISYDQSDVLDLVSTDLLTCGHELASVYYSTDCGVCNGTGVRTKGASGEKNT